MLTSYVCLLRGVNLGSARQVSMPRLKQLFVELGLESVATYIRSGNVVFRSADRPDAVRRRIEDGLEARLEMDIPVVLRTHHELADVLARNPFPEADPARLAVNLLSANAPDDLAERLGSVDLRDDEYVADGREIYLHLPHGFGRSKLAARMTSVRLPMVGTVRNWRTLTKLVEMSG